MGRRWRPAITAIVFDCYLNDPPFRGTCVVSQFRCPQISLAGSWRTFVRVSVSFYVHYANRCILGVRVEDRIVARSALAAVVYSSQRTPDARLPASGVGRRYGIGAGPV